MVDAAPLNPTTSGPIKSTTIKSGRKNEPRFLDYRKSPLPLDVALSFLLNSEYEITSRELILLKQIHVNDAAETNCHRLICRYTDRIALRGVELQRPLPMPRYFICYKPRGVICSNKRNEGIDRSDAVYISNWLKDAFETHGALINMNMKAINTVGRLDEESEGLLLLTNDGSFSRLLCDPEFGLAKTYRVVAKGSGFSNMKSKCHDDATMAIRITEMIHKRNQIRADKSLPKSQIIYDTCKVLDVGKLPSQHFSDDSYYILVDLTLREGKTHAVRRIIKNGGLRVCYLSRIQVEGLDMFSVAKPSTLIDAETGNFLPSTTKDAKIGKLLSKADSTSDSLVLRSGDIAELKSCQVDSIFSLRHASID
jgi:pseudouridine synthase